MVYNEKYNRWCDTTGKIFIQTKDGKFVECKQSKNKDGYLKICYGVGKTVSSHRLIFETLKGPIPQGYEIDHINTIRDDNRIDNLRCVMHLENMNNKLTKKHKSDSQSGVKNSNYHRIHSSFGKMYFEHFGYGFFENKKQYRTEHRWYKSHNNTCRWEVK